MLRGVIKERQRERERVRERERRSEGRPQKTVVGGVT